MTSESRMNDTTRNAELDRWLEEGEAPAKGEHDLDSLFDAIHADVEAEARSPLARARSLSTLARRMIALVFSTMMVAMVAMMMPRPDLAALPLARQLLVLGAGGLVTVLALVWTLRPSHVPTLVPWKPPAAAAFAIGLAGLLALMAPIDAHGAASAYPCLLGGLAMGLPLLFVAFILDRGSSAGPILIAVAAGMVGYLTLHLHCPVDERMHILLGHASVVLVFVIGAIIARGLHQAAGR